MSDTSFLDLLRKELPEISSAVADKIDHYRDLVLAENETQNLTRILDPIPFIEGHILDCLELRKSGFLGELSMDLGSGAGVPGLIAACFGENQWLLVDSEKKKAEFIQRAVNELGLTNVQVFGDRAENVLKTRTVDTVVARAVGPIERIYGWIRGCSTWNTLVLLKGPSWEEEWQAFQQTSAGKKLRITGEHRYTVGAEQKKRIIVQVAR